MVKLTRRTLIWSFPFVVPGFGPSLQPMLAMSPSSDSAKGGSNAPQAAARKVKYVHTSFGEIAYTDHGRGQPALFVHAAFLNGYQWREVIPRVADLRRIIAIDLMAHGATKIQPDQDLSFMAQADMLKAVCEGLKLEKVDLVANDTGGGIAQIFAAKHPDRIRTLTLTNCDAYDNWPPEAVLRIMQATDAQFEAVIRQWLMDINSARAAFSSAYEHPDLVSDGTFRTYFAPLVQTPEAFHNFHRFFLAADNRQTVSIEPLLKRLESPTLIVWGTDDQVFGIKWATWLGDTIPGTRKVVFLKGARLFFPEEHPEELANLLRDHWIESEGPYRHA